MVRNVFVILYLASGACISAAAPGTRPGDMTALAHVQACRSHAERAKQLEIAERFASNEGYSDSESQREYDIARQHGKAAKVVDPGAPDCP